ncbi:hypothetical protein CsSME_00000939 [Camellia sinensis var. sinensis]
MVAIAHLSSFSFLIISSSKATCDISRDSIFSLCMAWVCSSSFLSVSQVNNFAQRTCRSSATLMALILASEISSLSLTFSHSHALSFFVSLLFNLNNLRDSLYNFS